MTDPVHREMPALGPVALVRWAWGAYREAKARGLLKLDPARRHWRRWVDQAMALAGFLLPVVFAASQEMLFVVRPQSFTVEILLYWIALLFLFPALGCILGVRVFLLERRADTMAALRMTPLPRKLLILMRFIGAFRPILYSLVGFASGVYVVGLAIIEDLRLGFLFSLLSTIVPTFLAFAGCAYGVRASARCRGLTFALTRTSLRLALTILRMAIAAIPITVAVLMFTAPFSDFFIGGLVLAVASLLFVVDVALMPLNALRTAALKFDDWAEKAGEAA